MNSSPHDNFRNDLSPAEQTLRLIANLPAPPGLAERVQAKLRTAPESASVLHWPASGRSMGGWMHSAAFRGAAAAAIVCVVAGGGWRIYSHVQPAPTARVIVMPARIGSSSGFSSAGAMRMPDPMKAPVHAHAAATNSAQSQAVKLPAKSARRAKAAASKAASPIQPSPIQPIPVQPASQPQ